MSTTLSQVHLRTLKWLLLSKCWLHPYSSLILRIFPKTWAGQANTPTAQVALPGRASQAETCLGSRVEKLPV